MIRLSSYLLFLSMALLLISCGDDSQNQKQPPVDDSSEQQSTDPQDLTAQALYHLESYYRSLEEEQVAVEDYFAPTVEQFFSSQDISRERIAESLKGTFQQVENRRLSIDPQSVTVEKLPNGYQVQFSGESQLIRSESGEEVTSTFQNQVTFNQDWKITRYENARTRGLPARTEAATPARRDLMTTAELTLDAFRSGDLASLAPLIHPEHGLFLITKPGAMPATYRLENVAGLTRYTPWLDEGRPGLPEKPTEAAIPDFSCTDLFAREGCFLARLDQPYTGLSDLMKALNRAETGRVDTQMQNATEKMEQHVSAQMVDTDWGVGLYFGQIDGKWYLLVMDLATYDCSA